MSDDDAWYYCLKHSTVEHGPGCRATDRLGPFPDERTAARALDLAAERTRDEDRKDEEWNG
ncbi:hypothetical protein [Yinghuangia seranimata]|uniref:hypothetical protein n=1 Tax=Yinghuangia seranimata TaxID=408067 RepID=UPI00248C7541|nr:hypothetical protein [Yinghuangia seranimata]MDI2132791.1 hypothetical protein [Yinghuangia seranimata]